MIGRRPEYLGKKIESYEMKMAAIMILFRFFFAARDGPCRNFIFREIRGGNRGVHGFSEILYAFSSTLDSNGSAFAGSVDTSLNITEAVCMFIGRFWLQIPILAVAGSLVKEESPGHIRHFADLYAAVCFLADCGGGDCRRIKLLPGAVAGTDWRVLEIKVEIWRNYYFGKNRKQAANNQHRIGNRALPRRMYQRAIVDAFAKLDPALDDT